MFSEVIAQSHRGCLQRNDCILTKQLFLKARLHSALVTP